jgi:hypothetical protein
VIVTADHGHVLGVGLTGKGDVSRSGEGGDRWRVADRAPSEDEALLRGPRVLLGDDRGVLAPWHDDLRYSAKHGGYHGGATPDECVVPLSVFAPVGSELPTGWDRIAVPTPAWWDLHVDVQEAAPTTPTKRRRKTEATQGQGDLFGGRQAPDRIAKPEPASAQHAAPWIDAVIASETYAVQLGAVGRSKPPEDRVRTTLAALHQRGGVASYAVIAQATGMPLARVQGFLPILARLLNVDGFGVLTVDQTAQEARLDESLLLAQFSVGGTK